MKGMLRLAATAALVLPVAAVLNAAATSYTVEQATAGKALYGEQCAACHAAGGAAPPLVGGAFARNWSGKSAGELFAKIRDTMPTTNPHSLSENQTAALIAYIYQQNNVVAGAAFPRSVKEVGTATVPVMTEGRSAEAAAAPTAPMPPSVMPKGPLPPILAKLTPVTDATLRNPSPADWLIWRRTYDSHGFSPLAKINKANVKSLRMAWSWQLAPGPMEATPIVHDGVLFIESGPGTVQAFDGATGDLLWAHSRKVPAELLSAYPLVRVKRSMAIYGETLLVPTIDSHLIALDMRTGRVVWDKEVADYKKTFMLTAGPIVARGKIFQGISGSYARQAGGAGIVALDAKSGEEVWRFNTVARDGTPGGETWNDLPVERRSGGSVWVPGSYDPDNNLLYFGTGQTYDVNPLREKSTKPGVTNDALYTDTTLAIDPDTGKLIWHFQHLPNDLWDLDWSFERTVATIDGKRMVVTAGKQAIFEALDAKTGKYGFNYDFGLQNVVTAIDPVTGAKTISPDTVRWGEKVTVNKTCPTEYGARNWIATSYDAASHLLYIPLDSSCTDGLRSHVPEQGDTSVGNADASKLKFGYIAALDLKTRKVAWTERTAAAQTSAMLATAGGLLFNSNLDRWFRANDAKTGAELWKVRLSDVANAYPITYEANGRQYVAIATGSSGVVLTKSKSTIAPQYPLPGTDAATLWVFELPN
ncbi:PQQ-binding-like beta-propeller repeat protein [Sphingomonas montanisoli]|uniref:PQQ-binding-like beta-propeller repeat protein n=2 Tax=Sphingomonas montanisoli TaxID=2606412 RepID=A0A5D9C1E2_9SPHN|nr:PQQ-binding-like beta-propeller repeat protein [Sphingomonas montanisoli]